MSFWSMKVMKLGQFWMIVVSNGNCSAEKNRSCYMRFPIFRNLGASWVAIIFSFFFFYMEEQYLQYKHSLLFLILVHRSPKLHRFQELVPSPDIPQFFQHPRYELSQHRGKETWPDGKRHSNTQMHGFPIFNNLESVSVSSHRNFKLFG